MVAKIFTRLIFCIIAMFLGFVIGSVLGFIAGAVEYLSDPSPVGVAWLLLLPQVGTVIGGMLGFLSGLFIPVFAKVKYVM